MRDDPQAVTSADHTPRPVEPLLGYNSSRAGSVGEVEVASRLFREGLDVAKPLWNDDEVDLLVIKRKLNSFRTVVIPIQVKTVQFLDPSTKTRDIEGLRQRYVDENPGLCLAVYCPHPEGLWLVPGRDNIIALYDAQQSRRKAKNTYDNIPIPRIDDEDRPERREVTLKMDNPAKHEWVQHFVARDDQFKFRKVIMDLVERIDGRATLVEQFESMWTIDIKRPHPGVS